MKQTVISPRRFLLLTLAATGAAAALASCGSDKGAKKEDKPVAQAAAPVDAGPPAPPPVTYDRLPRADFNRLAAQLAQPLFWREDANGNNLVDPAEVAVLWGVSKTPRADWVAGEAFTPRFTEAYEAMVKARAAGEPAVADEKEKLRRLTVLKELDQGRPTLVQSSFVSGSAEDKVIVQNLLEAAELVEKLHLRQVGSWGLDKDIPADDVASRALFHRNQGPWCAAPATEKDENCNALPAKPARISGMYPADIQADKKFCETLAARKDGDALLNQFVVVSKDEKGELKAVPYHEFYKEDMTAISAKLKAAADAIQSAEEAAFKAYLTAAAQSFLDNNWNPADEAWSKMSVSNSKWYLRVAPDEVYFEPCSRKAGFHMSFARINQDSLKWQQKLDPVKGDMEKEMAKLAGAPYKARNVSFHLPDFIDIVINAGDSRPPHGATIGQSLPNWGPVANEGRGRTVAMTNFYTDADSKKSLKDQVESLLCKGAMAAYTDSPEPQLMSTVLHEAAHNLGPAHEYKVKGKTDDQIFGGPLASTLEELKAQTAALYFTDWLVEKKLITREEADKAHVRDVAWAFGHISRGMYQDDKPKPYSQLAAIQMGFLLKEGALQWNAEEMAANGTDKGCFQLNLEKFPPAIKKMGAAVVSVKGKGDKKAAEALKKEFVDDAGQWKTLRDVITERWLRSPKASFVYSVEL
ncbi:MAG: hypothetical protein AB2A00_15665 [Myxococcota bacterium]